MSTRIEIQEQPERERWWAEVEIGGMVARRRDVTSPRSAGVEGIIAAVLETHAAMLPRPKPKPPEPVEEPPPGPRNVDERRWVSSLAGSDALHIQRVDYSPPSDERDALRAAAEAVGVRVDGRWSMDRLRQEIASVGSERAAESDA